MYSNLQTLSTATYTAYTSSLGTGKIYVPVKPSEVVYSQFEHVSGVAANKGQTSGVPISKINILNTLIDQLVQFKKDKTTPQIPTDLSDTQVDTLIKDYQNQIHTALSVAQQSPFGMAGKVPLNGVILNAMV